MQESFWIPKEKNNCFNSYKTLLNPQESQSVFAQAIYRLSETLEETKTLGGIFISCEESNCETFLSLKR